MKKLKLKEVITRLLKGGAPIASPQSGSKLPRDYTSVIVVIKKGGQAFWGLNKY